MFRVIGLDLGFESFVEGIFLKLFCPRGGDRHYSLEFFVCNPFLWREWGVVYFQEGFLRGRIYCWEHFIFGVGLFSGDFVNNSSSTIADAVHVSSRGLNNVLLKMFALLINTCNGIQTNQFCCFPPPYPNILLQPITGNRVIRTSGIFDRKLVSQEIC